MKTADRGTVILLHGIGLTRRSMRGLEKKLHEAGYATCNLTYPSTSLPLEEICDFLHPLIQDAEKNAPPPLHFVTHSMGGLVARAYLNKYRPAHLGRVVMLAPPHHGSEVADFLQARMGALYRFFYGPAGQQLTTRFNRDEICGSPDYETAILTGDFNCYNPFARWMIKGTSDGLVSVASTRLTGMKTHKTVHASHRFIMNRPEVVEDVLTFLGRGELLKK